MSTKKQRADIAKYLEADELGKRGGRVMASRYTTTISGSQNRNFTRSSDRRPFDADER